jgi:hypothetical protein
MSRNALTLGFVLFAACGGGAQGPASRSAAPFNPATSDAKAIAIADDVLAAVGGAVNWAKAKEIVWSQAIIVDGEVKDFAAHAWDRWNARHQFTHYDAQGNVGKTSHDLFGDYSFGYKNGNEAPRAELHALVDDAMTRFNVDTYPLFLPFKLKDPGVHLAFSEERQEEGAPKSSPMKYDVIKITFDSGTGPASGDTYYLIVDKATHMPFMVEKVAAGKKDDMRSGFRFEEWKEVAGLKFATKRVTLGYGDEKGPQVVLKVPGYSDTDPIPKISVPAKLELVWITHIQANPDVDDLRYVKPVAPDRL